MKKYLSIITVIILPILTTGLFVFQIVLSNELTDKGAQLTKYEEGIDTLSKENGLIEREIASYSSLLTVEERAKALGFSPAKTVMVVADSQYPVALLNSR